MNISFLFIILLPLTLFYPTLCFYQLLSLIIHLFSILPHLLLLLLLYPHLHPHLYSQTLVLMILLFSQTLVLLHCCPLLLLLLLSPVPFFLLQSLHHEGLLAPPSLLYIFKTIFAPPKLHHLLLPLLTGATRFTLLPYHPFSSRPFNNLIIFMNLVLTKKPLSVLTGSQLCKLRLMPSDLIKLGQR